MTTPEQEKFYQMLGDRIRDARKKLNLKQETFAAFLNLSRASIVNIEKGRQHPPIHVLWDIAKVLNIEVVELLPQFASKEKVSPKWKKIIRQQSKVDKNTQDKLLGFIEEHLSQNS